MICKHMYCVLQVLTQTIHQIEGILYYIPNFKKILKLVIVIEFY